jgi:hypothetical protein
MKQNITKVAIITAMILSLPMLSFADDANSPFLSPSPSPSPEASPSVSPVASPNPVIATPPVSSNNGGSSPASSPAVSSNNGASASNGGSSGASSASVGNSSASSSQGNGSASIVVSASVVSNNNASVSVNASSNNGAGSSVAAVPAVVSNNGGSIATPAVVVSNNGASASPAPAVTPSPSPVSSPAPVVSNNGGGGVAVPPVSSNNGGGGASIPPVSSNNGGGTSATVPLVNSNNGGGSAPATPTPIPPVNGGSGGGTVVSNNGGGNGPVFGALGQVNSGGGGNGPIAGSLTSGIGSTTTLTPAQIAYLSNTCNYLVDYIHVDWKNDSAQVLKLQQFLNNHEGITVPLNGFFDQKTFEAVVAFQAKYATSILGPWGGRKPSGFVYITTRKKINELYCQTTFNLSAAQLATIEAYREAHTTAGSAQPSITNNGSVKFITPTESTAPQDEIFGQAPASAHIASSGASRIQTLTASVFTSIGRGMRNIFSQWKNFLLKK